MAKLVVGENDLATRFPALAAEWDPSKNGDLTPRQVTAGSTCGHEWPAVVANRTLNGSGCPGCPKLGTDSPVTPGSGPSRPTGGVRVAVAKAESSVLVRLNPAP